MRKKIGQVTLHMYKPSKPLKNGLFVPYIKIIYDGDAYHISTRCEITEIQWNEYDQCPEVNHPLSVEWEKVSGCVTELTNEGDFSLSALKMMLQGGRHTSVQAFARERAVELREQGKFNTASLCDLTASTLDEFAGCEVRFSKCNTALCKDYINWLSEVRKNSPTTVSIRARNLSSILGKAVEKHLLHSNPMLKVKKPSSKRKEMKISEQSLEKLLNAKQGQLSEKEFHYLQYFRCIYYGNGLNMVDLLHLRHDNIKEQEIVFSRKKTKKNGFGKEIHIALLPELVQAINLLAGGIKYIIPILDHYDENSEEEFKAVQQAIKTTNKYLSRACASLSIPEKVTTNFARHAFATRLLQKGVPIEFISDALGHSNIRTTQHYLEGYTSEQRKQAATLLKF